MKKTITINIAGIVFNIEENGYAVLQKYLEEIKRLFSSEEGVNEMLEDIEARIAELFHKKLGPSKQVITEEDVVEVINLMGQPTDYGTQEESFSEEKNNFEGTRTEQKANKRLYRDEENGSLGGVCAGLGHYFDLDPVVFRVIFVLMVILGGSGVLVYIILWIAVPEAKTTAQKLQMRGQPVNLDNIKEYVSGFTKEAKGGVSKAAETIKNSVNKSSRRISSGFKLLSKILGFGILFGGIMALTTGIMLYFGNVEFISFTSEGTENSMKTIFHAIYPDNSSTMAYWALFFVIFLPVAALITLGVKLLFGYKGKFRGSFLSGLIVWVVALSIFIYASIEMGLQFKSDYKTSETVINKGEEIPEILQLEMDFSNNHIYASYPSEQWIEQGTMFISDNSIEIGFPSFRILRDSTVNDFEISIIRSSKGKNPKDAMEKARSIEFSPSWNGNTLKVPVAYSFPVEDKIRGQHVMMEIRVPLGKKINIPSNQNHMTFEVYSEKNYKYSVHKNPTKWISSPEGMKCLNCIED